MIALLLSCTALATGCAAPASQQASPPTTKVAASDLFPEPKSGISIQVEPGNEMNLEELLAEFANVTGLHLVIARETSALLKQRATGLLGSVEVPAGEVYPFVESVLVHNDFVLTPLTNREPRLVAVYSSSMGPQRGGSLRNTAIFVTAEEVQAYSRHPAILVTTVINMPSTDVRTLSNSMRTMFTDANTQQIIPVGNSNSLILTGYGSQVASLVAMMKRVDDDARREIEAAEKKAKENPSPPLPPPVQPPK